MAHNGITIVTAQLALHVTSIVKNEAAAKYRAGAGEVDMEFDLGRIAPL